MRRRRDRRTKERLRRTVVTKHLERARKGEISLDEIPFAPEDAPPIVRELPGPGKFSIRKTTVPAAPAPARGKPSGSSPAPKKKPEKDAQQSLPLTVSGYPSPPVSLLEKRQQSGCDRPEGPRRDGPTDRREVRRVRRGRGGHRVSPGPVVTTFEFKPSAGVKSTRSWPRDDLALALKAESIRIERIPGSSTVGIEVPEPGGGDHRVRDIIESERSRAPVAADPRPRQGHPRRARRRPTSRACRISSSPAPPAPASRSASTP